MKDILSKGALMDNKKHDDSNGQNIVRRSHFIKSDKINFTYYEMPEKNNKSKGSLSTALYFPIAVLFMEFILKLSSGFSILDGLWFTLIFTVFPSFVFTVISSIFKSERINRGIAFGVSVCLSIYYNTQVVYYNVFGTFFVVSSISNGGAGQALNSVDMIMTAIKSRIVFIILIFLPIIFLVIFSKRLNMFYKSSRREKILFISSAVCVQIIGVSLVNFTAESKDAKSPYNLYYGELQQNTVCERFGLLTMQRLDMSRLLFGASSKIVKIDSGSDALPATADTTDKKKTPNIIDTDFKKLSDNEDSEELKSLYEYFSENTPSYTNEYTGCFDGYNIIFITAESFSQYAVDKELTPTLYKLYSEGFQFDNYYLPAWGVSTTDGEYANLTGLIPKSGVWSFSQSAEQNINFPFSLGEQSRNNGYEKVLAYHNHTYDYYDRDEYLKNIGYDYKAIGKGLDLGENVWPNSDLKMMQNTVDDYITADSFSVYYMTVSGHGGYSYNTISERNAELVKNLDYSDEVKGYLAANIELDRAVEYLINRLEKADKLDNTVICITSDHYPYSLDEFNGLDELAGHKVDTVFERYKNSWLLWSGSMEKPVSVKTYCSSIDVLPTMLNMLGFEYDSRTLSGTDVFGGKDPFVVFADRSWISQNGMYNSNSGEYTAFKNSENKDDIGALNSKCSNMFTVSRMILDNNAYEKIFSCEHIKGQ